MRATAGYTGARAMRMAFFGGSFDPPHLGHLAVARAARDAFRLDTVLFAPVGAQPLKPEGSTAGYEDGVAMTRLAIAAEPGFDGLAGRCAEALRRGGRRRTTHLITRSRRWKGCAGELVKIALFFLMGADSFLGLSRWHRAAEIPFAAPLIVASRPGQTRRTCGRAAATD